MPSERRAPAVAREPLAVPAIDFLSPSALDAEAEREWSLLAADAAEPNVFAESWFALPSLRHLAKDGDIALAVCRSGGVLIGVMPLWIASRYGRMRVRHVANWRHHHAFLGTPLIKAGHERSFWAALLDTLDTTHWASGFLHVEGLVEGGPVHAGLVAATAERGRAAPVVHRHCRALLESDLDPATYYERNVRAKKRKEIRRLSSRLGELGNVRAHRLAPGEDVTEYCDLFLALERSGWKGRAGSALAHRRETEAFFRDVVAGAQAEGRLDFIRLDLDSRPVAMLVNFLAPPGAFSFKIAFDEAYARFSPGVLIELENLQILSRPEIDWMDSCAAERHSMIDSLWGERRSIVRISVRLSGIRRGLTYGACRALETGSAWRRRWAA